MDIEGELPSVDKKEKREKKLVELFGDEKDEKREWKIVIEVEPTMKSLTQAWLWHVTQNKISLLPRSLATWKNNMGTILKTNIYL